MVFLNVVRKKVTGIYKVHTFSLATVYMYKVSVSNTILTCL